MRTLCGTILAAMLSLSANANSVASFCERAQKGDRLTVAFLGGSLSWGNLWGETPRGWGETPWI